jgi:hypothetical protein
MTLSYLRYLFVVLLFLSVGLVLCRSEMAGGRDDAGIVEALAE